MTTENHRVQFSLSRTLYGGSLQGRFHNRKNSLNEHLYVAFLTKIIS